MQAQPGRFGSVIDENKLEALRRLDDRLRWLSAWTIHNANHLRPSVDGLKVGGHQASCASMTAIMAALYFHALGPNDKVAVKPHAGPILHAIHYLLGSQTREQLENFDEREIDRIQAIIQSMTPAERANPKMIDGSRRARIAKGSGRQVSDVNGLVDRFFEARKMMMQFARGGMPGTPGMEGVPGFAAAAGRRKVKNKPAKGRRVSGNPAKAAQQKAAQKTASDEKAANPFGNPDGADVDYEKAAEQLNLPKDFSQFLK